MGVWIETGKHWMTSAKPTSHPVWVCGLKHGLMSILGYYVLSHPVWVCGLKPSIVGGAPPGWCHTLYGCVD